MYRNFRTINLTLLLIVAIICSCLSSIAQTSTNGIHFQALARDNYNNPAKDRIIYIQASIIQKSSTNSVLITEEFKTTTDKLGVFDINIGQGNRVAGIVSSIDAIDWSILPSYLNVKISVTPISPIENWDYTKEWIDLGTTTIGSVPHALFAENVRGFNSKLNISDSLNVYVTPNQLKLTTEVLKSTNQAVVNLSGINTGDETNASIKAKLGVNGFFSGNYNDLSNIPTLFSGTYADLNGKPDLTLKEDARNKSVDVMIDAVSDIKYPSVKAVKTYIDAQIASSVVTDGSIVTNKLANTAVTTAKVADGAITNSKIANPAVANLSGINTGDETSLSIKAKLGVSSFFSGSYNDLTNKPILFSGAYSDLTNKPALFSGNYMDLINRPAIPLAQIQSDWLQSNNTQLDFIKNKPLIPSLGNYVFNGNLLTTSSNELIISTAQNADGIYLYPYGTDGMGTGAGEIDIENSGIRIWSKGGNPGSQVKWDFDQVGNITLPAGGDILDADGNSVINMSNKFGNFSMSDNSILATSSDSQNPNIDPVFLGNDIAKLELNNWSENNSHLILRNFLDESTIVLYSNGNGSSRLLWENINDVNNFARLQASENTIYLRINDDVNGVDHRWYFNYSGDIELPDYGTIIFNDGYGGQTYLSDILPMPTYNSGYVLTEDGNGGASWQDKSAFTYLEINNDGNYPGIYLKPNDLSAPTWLRVGNDDGGAEYGIVGGSNQFFDGTVQGDIALKAFSNSNDKKMFIGATFGGQANLVLSPSGLVQSNGKIITPELSVGNSSNNQSAIVEINSTTKGFLPPRMLENEKNNIRTPVAGLMVWCIDCGTSGLGELQIFNGTTWNGFTQSIPDYTIVGSQKWSTKNLDVSTYANGDKIYRATNAQDFSNASANGIGAYIYFDDDSLSNAAAYGKLYNWYAVNDSRGLAPTGWHVPSRNEVQILANYLGGNSLAGGKMKEQGSKHWIGQNIGATNLSGFNGLPGGYIDYLGSFSGLGLIGSFWTTTSIVPGMYSNYYTLFNNSILIDIPNSPNYDIGYGLSVRCLKN